MMIGEWEAPSPPVMPDTPKPKNSPLHDWRTLSHSTGTIEGGAQDKTTIVNKPLTAQLKGGGGAISIPLPDSVSTISNRIIPLAKAHAKSLSEIVASRGKHELIALAASLVALPRLAPKSTAKFIALLQCMTVWGSKHTLNILKRVKSMMSALVALTIARAHRLTTG